MPARTRRSRSESRSPRRAAGRARRGRRADAADRAASAASTHVAGGDRAAHRRARHVVAVDADRSDDLDREPEPRAELRRAARRRRDARDRSSRCGRRRPAWRASRSTMKRSTNASAESSANARREVLHARARRCRLAAISRILSRSDVISAGARSGRSTATGCGLNVNATASPPPACAASATRAENRLVPAMDAVEIAERQDRRDESPRARGDVTEDFHSERAEVAASPGPEPPPARTGSR